MRSGKSPITPSMAVAMTALAAALGGTAFAAAGRDASSSDTGLVQACVAQKNIVNSITDPVAGAVNSATAGALTSVTSAVTPAGTLIVVAPGTSCPASTTPQSLSSTAPTPLSVYTAHSKNAQPLNTAKSFVAGATLPAGSYLATGQANIIERGVGTVTQTVKCVLVNPNGRAIPGTTISATIPPGDSGARLTLPISVVLHNVPAGMVALDCKDALPTGATTAGAKTPKNGSVPVTNADGTISYVPEHPCYECGTGDDAW